MRAVTALLSAALLLLLSAFVIAHSQAMNPDSETYLNMRFWDAETGRCFSFQETTNSCVSASVQMVLRYLDYSPLPNQTQLATEMHTDINRTTQWKYVYIPFNDRGFSEYINQSLSQDFNQALSYLRGNLTKNFPIIINTWFDEEAKSNGSVTHARVVTGYNSTGIFFNDPGSGPNEFLNYSEFSNLWQTDSGFWAFIVKSQPKFDITIEVKDSLGNPVQGISLLLKEANLTQITNSNGTAQFLGIPIANYTVSYEWRLQSETRSISLTYSKKIDFQVYLSDLTILLIVAIVAAFVVAVMAIVKIRHR